MKHLMICQMFNKWPIPDVTMIDMTGDQADVLSVYGCILAKEIMGER